MKINELKPSQAKELIKSKWQAPHEIREWLMQNNFRYLGGGSFSSVYASRNSNIAIKVSGGDTCWLKFVDYVNKNKEDHHLPKVSRVMRFKVKQDDPDEDDFFIAFIERLEPLASGTNILPNDLEGLTYLGNWFRKDYLTRSNKLFAYKYAKANPTLFKSLQNFRKIIRRECTMDTHYQNFMIRKSTGDIVISDPVSWPIKK